jgi:hypothetical protein
MDKNQSPNLRTIKLNNFEIKKLTDKNLQDYFMIINNDNRDEVYFCFQSRVKEGWDILSKSPSPINIEIEYEENVQNDRVYKRATALYTDDDIFV